MMHSKLERVVAQHIETLEKQATDDAAYRDELIDEQRELLTTKARLERELKEQLEKNAKLIKDEGDEKRGMQLLNQLRNVLKTTARGHDLVKVADSMFRELIALREQTQPVPTESKAVQGVLVDLAMVQRVMECAPPIGTGTVMAMLKAAHSSATLVPLASARPHAYTDAATGRRLTMVGDSDGVPLFRGFNDPSKAVDESVILPDGIA